MLESTTVIFANIKKEKCKAITGIVSTDIVMQLNLTESDFKLNQQERERVLANFTEFRDKLLAVKSPNTVKAYVSDFRHYLDYCHARQLVVMSSDWRVTKRSIEAYFDRLVDMPFFQHNGTTRQPRYYSANSIKRRLASIRYFLGVA